MAFPHCVVGHEVSEEDTKAPVDSILWIHIFPQAAVWGILFPIGMVLGLTRSRWHVPLQATGFLLTFTGYILGHSHKDPAFPGSAHGIFGNILVILMLYQLALGIYLKLHMHEKTFRPYLVGQCLGHYIIGSVFIAYGTIMVILLLVGEAWVRRSNRSPEWWDSWVIMFWVIINTFTGQPSNTWSIKDMQHTILGILWWTGGLLEVFMSRNKQRNIVPSLMFRHSTGWMMSQHAQALMLAHKVHSAFGYTLFFAGFARIIEICFLPSTSMTAHAPTTVTFSGSDDGSTSIHMLDEARYVAEAERTTWRDQEKVKAAIAFRHLPPFALLISSHRLLLIAATDEELENVHDHKMDPVTYILIMFSITFLLYFFINFLIHLYANSGRNVLQQQQLGNEEGIHLLMGGSNKEGEGKWYYRVPVIAGAANRE
ncbi:hypothetical protein AMATHDRAFT_77108 [Amanita thiersii Skay4041]|uniref:Cytochrome b561 domain-containing protein n=1 Tax=Amanita thiersii Skay4041 TaxID=703135 RepID=A0A2A9NIV7_9AGAR|nr:hypothetical protein AMATHDRAFT_77108 [Amanita thiersii Skay4041]